MPMVLRRPWRCLMALLAISTVVCLSGCAANATTPPPTAAPGATVATRATSHSGTATPAPPQGVAALVNGEQIPLWEFHALLILNLENSNAVSAPATSPLSQTVRRDTVRQIVDEALLNAYAERHGLAVSDATVSARIEAYRLQSGTGFAASLARLGVSETQFRRMIARNLNAQAVTQHVIGAINAPAVRVQVVQIAVTSRAGAQWVYDNVRRGTDAPLIAAQQSVDPNLRRLAGQLPPLTRAEGDALYGPNWSHVAFALPAGHVSRPIHLRDGWAVLQVVERLPAASLMQHALDSFVNSLRRTSRTTTYVT